MHPQHDELKGFVTGLLDDDTADQVTVHIANCPRCEETVDELERTCDTFVDPLRGTLDPPNPFQDEPQRQKIIEVLCNIGRDATTATREAANEAETADLGEFGQYKLLAKLGEGGMGAVYKALHTRLRRVVALKVLPAERTQNEQAVARFDREMEAVGGLSHANVVAAHDAGEIDGRHYLVMEMVDGIDLSKLVRRVGPLDVADACELVRQTAVGLQYAHERGMVHRDIKPSNLMLAQTEKGEPLVKILDMGLALLEEADASDRGELTTSGQMMGTLDYMSPEQGLDSHLVDIRSDIYSLGATLAKLLTGEPPFSGPQYDTPGKMLVALSTQSPPSIATKRDGLPPGLVAVIDQMLCRSADERFATPQEVADALAPFAAGANLQALLDAASAARDAESLADPMSATVPHLTSGSHETGSSQSAAAPARKVPAQRPPVTPAVKPAVSRGKLYRRAAIAATLAGVVLAAVVALTLRTPHGEVVVELGEGVDSEQVKIEVVGNGDLKVIDPAANWTISVAEGKYDVRLADAQDRFKLDKNSVVVTRNEKLRVRVTLKSALSIDETKDDRQLAEWFVSLSPTNQVRVVVGEEMSEKVHDLKDIPKGRWRVINAWTDALSDEDAKRIIGFEDLVGLSVSGSSITDRGLEGLGKLPVLRQLQLGKTNIAGSGLKSFAGHQYLISLYLNETKVSDENLPLLQALQRLSTLNLDSTNITDAGLEHLEPLESLTQLTLRDLNGVTARGIARLHVALPSCKISSDYSDEELKPLIAKLGGAAESSERWHPGLAENVLPGLIPRPAKLPGIGRWQVLPMPQKARVYLSPDGNYLAWLPSMDVQNQFLVLQETQSRRPIGFLPLPEAQSGRVPIAWHPQSTHLAIGEGLNVHFMHIQGEVRTVHHFLGYNVAAISWSPAGKTLAATLQYGSEMWLIGSEGTTTDVVEISDVRKLYSLLAWSPDGSQIAVASINDKLIRIFALDGSVGPELVGSADGILSVDWSPDGKWIAAGIRESGIRLWKPDGTPGPVKETEGWVDRVAWSPDSQWLAFHENRNAKKLGVRVWRPADDDFRYVATLRAPLDIHWSPDSKWLILNEPHGPVQLFSPDGNEGPKLGRDHDSVIWSRDGSRLLLADSFRNTQWFDIDGRSFPAVDAAGSAVEASYVVARWSPDGERLAFADSGGGVRIWMKDGSFVAELKGHTARASDLAWSSDGRYLATAGQHEKVRVWQADGSYFREFAGEGHVDFSRDGGRLATTRYPMKGVQIWNLDGTKGPLIEKAGESHINDVCWSPDGTKLAVASDVVAIFEADGTPGPVLEDLSLVSAVAWSPDGKRLAVGGRGKSDRRSIRVWRVDGAPGPALENVPNLVVFHLAWSTDGGILTAHHFTGHVNRWGPDGKLRESSELGRDVLRSEPSPDGKRLAIIREAGFVEVIDGGTREAQWVGIPLTHGQAATFTRAGQLLHAPPDVERQLIYVVEKPNGQFAVMSRGKFLRRANLPPEQTALQWIVDVGGSFQLEGDETVYSADNVKITTDLPSPDGAAVHVSLTSNQHFTTDELALLRPLENLAGLDLSHTKIAAPVEQIGRLSSLKELDLSHTRANNAALTDLAGLKSLTVLRLRKTVVTTSGLQHLAGLTQLREMDLAGTLVSDVGLEHITALTGLESLDLSGTNVSDAGLQTLKNSAQLRQLNLIGTRVTPSGATALRKALPECEIYQELTQ